MIERLKIFDNGGRTCDRYTVVYPREQYAGRRYYYPYVSMDENPFHPQGYGQHGELPPPGRAGFRHLGRRIKFEELPEKCQKLVMQDLSYYEEETS